MEGVRSTYADQMELWFMTGGGGGVLFHLGSTLGEYATVEVNELFMYEFNNVLKIPRS